MYLKFVELHFGSACIIVSRVTVATHGKRYWYSTGKINVRYEGSTCQCYAHVSHEKDIDNCYRLLCILMRQILLVIMMCNGTLNHVKCVHVLYA